MPLLRQADVDAAFLREPDPHLWLLSSLENMVGQILSPWDMEIDERIFYLFIKIEFKDDKMVCYFLAQDEVIWFSYRNPYDFVSQWEFAKNVIGENRVSS